MNQTDHPSIWFMDCLCRNLYITTGTVLVMCVSCPGTEQYDFYQSLNLQATLYM